MEQFRSKHKQTQSEWEAEMSKKVLEFVRSELYMDLRFLDIALGTLVYRADENIRSFATDGTYLYFSTEQVLRVFQSNPKYLDRAYLHSVLHCIFFHLWIGGKRDREKWNLACDIAVEYTIDQMDKPSTRRILSWQRQTVYEELKQLKSGISAAVIYRYLSGRKPAELIALQKEFYTDDHRYWPKEEQKNAEIQKMGTGYDDWVAGLDRIGTIGVYDEASQKKLDEITGCTEHKELGSSSDGKYKYYLSTNKDADEKLTKELEKIKTDITEMTPYQNISVFDQPQDTSVNPEDVKSVGKFETTGIDGKTYTEKVFSDYDLTLVNVFTTWCSPCVKEIPELQELYKEMKEKGVGVAGVVLDTTDEKGNQDEEAVKKAGILQEKTKAKYPFLIPDTTMMNGRLQGISAFPETFFVDKDGNIVGDTYTGSHTLDEWKEIVEKELKNVSK